MSENIIKIEDLLEICRSKPSSTAYYQVQKFLNCFTGNLGKDVSLANSLIAKIANNASAHRYTSTLKWAYQLFYGKKFVTSLILNRANEVSKFTTRLDYNQIQLIRQKFLLWINTCSNNLLKNRIESVKMSRLRIYHCFEALLSSGMRIGELTSIKFNTSPAHRFIYSKLNSQQYAEIIINTEKTCKKREIYIPLETYNFFTKNIRKYRFQKFTMSKDLITVGFLKFRKWAKLPFKFTAHVLRRTKATLMHEGGVGVSNIAMVLGNTARVVMEYYILSSQANFDACEIGNAMANGKVIKNSNIFLTNHYDIKK